MPVLGEQPTVVGDLVDRAAERLGDGVGQVVGTHPARHVGDVDPPAVEPVAQPVRRDRVGPGVEPTGQLGRGVVELGQARDVEPRGVAVLLGVGEPVERPLGRGRVLLRPHEPVVVLAGVVGGEVADQSQAVGVDGVGQPLQRLVAAEERVDPVEGHRVVAVGGPRLEDGRQVEQRRAQVVEVVEVLGDAVERAAVPLERRRRGPCARPAGPTRRGWPSRGRARRSRSCRSGRGRPGSRPGRAPTRAAGGSVLIRKSPPSVTSRACTPVAVSHAEVGGAGRDEEAVGRHPVDDAQPHLPPRAGRRPARPARHGRSPARRRAPCAARPRSRPVCRRRCAGPARAA